MWERHAAFERDFSKPPREASAFLAFRGGGISTAGLLFAPGAALFADRLRVPAAVVAGSGAPLMS